MKFTLCGAPGMALLLGCLWAARQNGVKGFFRCLGRLAAGFLLSTLPWPMYFGLNGAITDWLKTYLYDNLFLYSGGEGGLLWRAKADGEKRLGMADPKPAVRLAGLRRGDLRPALAEKRTAGGG